LHDSVTERSSRTEEESSSRRNLRRKKKNGRDTKRNRVLSKGGENGKGNGWNLPLVKMNGGKGKRNPLRVARGTFGKKRQEEMRKEGEV